MSENKTTIFKIRRKSDGLFSAGGSTPTFTKLGKLWKMQGHLTNHLRQLHNGIGTFKTLNNRHIYANCEIIEYELIERQIGPVKSIGEYLDEIANRKKVRDNASRDYHMKLEKIERKKQYDLLRLEFEE